nr:vacuolar protein sorting-associated protein 41 homolog [Tanacetum cinerariifolium]
MVEERFTFNVSLRMFTRSIVIQRRVEDLQLGVERYQKKLNLTKPDTYRSDLKHKEAYTAYSNPIGFIYQNKDKQNRLIRIDELQKFSDGTLNDVRTALDDLLKGNPIKRILHKLNLSYHRTLKDGGEDLMLLRCRCWFDDMVVLIHMAKKRHALANVINQRPWNGSNLLMPSEEDGEKEFSSSVSSRQVLHLLSWCNYFKGNSYAWGQWAAGNEPLYYVVSLKDVVIARPRFVATVLLLLPKSTVVAGLMTMAVAAHKAKKRLALANVTNQRP